MALWGVEGCTLGLEGLVGELLSKFSQTKPMSVSVQMLVATQIRKMTVSAPYPHHFLLGMQPSTFFFRLICRHTVYIFKINT